MPGYIEGDSSEFFCPESIWGKGDGNFFKSQDLYTGRKLYTTTSTPLCSVLRSSKSHSLYRGGNFGIFPSPRNYLVGGIPSYFHIFLLINFLPSYSPPFSSYFPHISSKSQNVYRYRTRGRGASENHILFNGVPGSTFFQVPRISGGEGGRKILFCRVV